MPNTVYSRNMCIIYSMNTHYIPVLHNHIYMRRRETYSQRIQCKKGGSRRLEDYKAPDTSEYLKSQKIHCERKHRLKIQEIVRSCPLKGLQLIRARSLRQLWHFPTTFRLKKPGDSVYALKARNLRSCMELHRHAN